MTPLFLATSDRLPYALGRSPKEARARAEMHLRAACDDMARQTEAAGLSPALVAGDAKVDLADIDPVILPLRWTLTDYRKVLGAMWDAEIVEAELEALGFAADIGRAELAGDNDALDCGGAV